MEDWSILLNAVAAVVVALGGKELIRGWWQKRSGKATEEKARMKEALEDVDDLREKLEVAHANLLAQKEYSSRLRRILIERGTPEGDIPAWPTTKK